MVAYWNLHRHFFKKLTCVITFYFTDRGMKDIPHCNRKGLFMFAFVMRAIAICLIVIAFATASKAQDLTESTKTRASAEPRKRPFTANYNHSYRQLSGTTSGNNYSYTPDSLKVSSLNLGLAYDLNSHYFINASTKYLKNEIELQKQSSSPFLPDRIDASTEGIGDSLVGVTRKWNLSSGATLYTSANISLPTGDYQEKTPSGTLVSYQGQLGSGTFDFAPYILYRHKLDRWSTMGRIQGRLRTGRNDLNYRLGDEIMAVGSVSYSMLKWLAVTGGVYYKNWREVVGSENVDDFNSRARAASHRTQQGARPSSSAHGSDPANNPHASPHAQQGPPPKGFAGGPPVQANSASTDSSDIFAAPGARWSAHAGLRAGIYLGPQFFAFLEGGLPVYNDQIGPLTGLNQDWFAVATIQSSF